MDRPGDRPQRSMSRNTYYHRPRQPRVAERPILPMPPPPSTNVQSLAEWPSLPMPLPPRSTNVQPLAEGPDLPMPPPPSTNVQPLAEWSNLPMPLPPSTNVRSLAEWPSLPMPLPPSTNVQPLAEGPSLPMPLPPSTNVQSLAEWPSLPMPLPPSTNVQPLAEGPNLPMPLPPNTNVQPLAEGPDLSKLLSIRNMAEMFNIQGLPLEYYDLQSSVSPRIDKTDDEIGDGSDNLSTVARAGSVKQVPKWRKLTGGMASNGSFSGDNTSSGGCTTPNSNPNYDSDSNSKDSFEDSEKNEEFYRCSACKQPYHDPRVLICLHTFCLRCLEGMVVTNGANKFVQCHQCRRLTHLSSGAIQDDVRRNYGCLRYTESLPFDCEDKLMCQGCKKGNLAIARCFDCPGFICTECVQSHEKMVNLFHHRVRNLGEPKEPSVAQHFCMNHTSVPMSVYCHDCRETLCEDCSRRLHQNCKKTTDGFLTELSTSLRLDIDTCQKTMDKYQNGLDRAVLSATVALEQISLARIKSNEYFDKLVKEAHEFKQNCKAQSNNMAQAFREHIKSLRNMLRFMEVQAELALPLDNMQTRPFIENVLQAITNTKPDVPRINYTVDFVGFPETDDKTRSALGYVSQNQYLTDQLAGSNQPPQPIARPTSVSRPNYNGMQTNNFSHPYNQADRSNGYGNVSGLSQNQEYRSNGYSQSSSRNQANVLGSYDQQSVYNNGYDHFRAQSPLDQHTTPSPVMSSGCGSARSLNDNVFNFNNLSLSSGSGTSTGTLTASSGGTVVNQSLHYPSLQSMNQDQTYQTWSNGVDQPSNAAPQPVVDVFTLSNNPMFEAPTPQRSSQLRSFSSITRKRIQFMTKFGEYGSKETQFTEPSGVAVDIFTRLLVADTNNHRIQVFDVFGNFLMQYGSTSGNKLTYPNRIAVSKTTGKIVITERAPSHRVQVYDIDGKHITTFGEDALQHPRGVCLDKDDNVIIIECKVMRVTIFTIQGRQFSRFGCSEHLQFPNSIAVNSKNEIFISDNRDHDVKVFNYRGHLLRKIGGEGLTNYPIAVAINERDEIVVADNHNNFNLTVFTQDGTFVTGYESKTKHAQCFDLALTGDGMAILTSKDFKVYCYPYQDGCRYSQMPHQ